MELTAILNGTEQKPLIGGSSLTKELTGAQLAKATAKWQDGSGFRVGESRLGIDTLNLGIGALQTIVIQDSGGTKHFNGFVTALERDYERPGLINVTADCQDFGWLTSTATITKSYTAQSDRAIILDVLAVTGLDADITANSSTVDIVEASLTISFENESVRDVLEQIAQLTGAKWTIDAEATLHYGVEANADPAAFNVSDDPDDVTTFAMEQGKYSRRFEKPVNRVVVEGGWDNSGNKILVTREDTASQTQFGRTFTETIVDLGITRTDLAELLGDRILAERAFPQETYTFRTTKDGLEVNTLIQVTSKEYGLNAKSFLITRIGIRQFTDTETEYEVECGTPFPRNDRQLRLLEKASRERTGAPVALPPVGGITETMISNDAISTPKIQANAITADKIIVNGVTESKIANLAVSNAKIQDAAISTAKIQNLAVSTAKIQNLAVDTAKIDDLAVTNAKIANLSVDTAKIQDASITTAKIGTAQITDALIANATITSAKIQSVKAESIEAGTITASVSMTSPNITSTFGSESVSLVNGQIQQSDGSGTTRLVSGSVSVSANFNSADATLFPTALFIQNPSGINAAILRTSGSPGLQSNSGGLQLYNSSGSVRVNIGTDFSNQGVVGLGGSIPVVVQAGSSSATAGVFVNGQKIIGVRQASVADPSGGANQDFEARIAIAGMLSALRNHGLINT